MSVGLYRFIMVDINMLKERYDQSFSCTLPRSALAFTYWMPRLKCSVAWCAYIKATV